MNHIIEQHYWKAVTFLIILILAGSGLWGLRRFHPTLFLGKPDFVATPETETEQHPDQEKQQRAKSAWLLNINTASAEELETLPHIGPRMAERIIEYRKKHGEFTSVDALQNVSGIGKKTLEKLRPFIRVDIDADIDADADMEADEE